MSDRGGDRGRARSDGSEERRGSKAGTRALLSALVAVAVLVGLGLPGSGCLNPRPEELPSSGAFADDADPVTPVRESCDDNPALAGCELPDEDLNDEPADAPSPSEGPANINGAPDSDDQGPAPPAGSDGGDAGSGEGSADAGAG